MTRRLTWQHLAREDDVWPDLALRDRTWQHLSRLTIEHLSLVLPAFFIPVPRPSYAAIALHVY